MRRKDLRLLAATSVTILAFAACGGGDDAGGEDEGDGSSGGAVTVTIQDFSFSPNELSVEAGAEVSIEVTNEGDTTHTFTSDDAGVDVSLDPGASDSVEFTAPESGELGWFCKIHTDMTGTIVVGGGTSSGSGSQDSDGDSTSLDY